ncbi:MAG: hypothetical protein JHC95_03740 [Solirubrobacteraceae bacterium]|nr:hypothetical protein [Solirubrobacteraceae bacterium]
MRPLRTTIFLAASAAAAISATPAPAAMLGTTLAELPQPTSVTARDGVVAYTQPAPRSRKAIVIRDAAGTRLLGADPVRRGTPLELGTDGKLAYPRCTGPQARTCRLAVTPLATGRERIVPNTRGAIRGIVDGARTVAVIERSDGVEEIRTFVGGTLRSTLRVPRRYSIADESSDVPVPRKQVFIDDLDARRGSVAFTVSYSGGDEDPYEAYAELWLQRPNRQLMPLTVLTTTGGSSGFKEFIGPRIRANDVVVYQQGFESGSGLYTYSLLGRQLGRASLRQGFGDVLVSGAFDRGRFTYIRRAYPGFGETDCVSELDEDGAATCALKDSGPVRFTR